MNMSVLEVLKTVNKDMLMGETITPFEELMSNYETSMKHRMELTVGYFQWKICKKMEELENQKKFQVDRWLRKEGGGGITCIMQDGEIIFFIILARGQMPPSYQNCPPSKWSFAPRSYPFCHKLYI